ncbi:MAG: hypothetical protein R6U66_04390 [Bacteroidales bacterium]
MKGIKCQAFKIATFLLIFNCPSFLNTLHAQYNNVEILDTIYNGVTINLTPTYPEEARNISVNMYNALSLLLLKEGKLQHNDEIDRIIIKLKSEVSWELSTPPKAPLFFLFSVAAKSKNKKVVNRIEYLKFNSLCEQKPKLVYKVIDYFEINKGINVYKVKMDSLNRFHLIK